MKQWKVPMQSLSSSVIIVEAETEEAAIAAAVMVHEIVNRNVFLISSEICSNGQVTEMIAKRDDIPYTTHWKADDA